MAKHILGLDIGKSSVKAVLIEAGMRGGVRIVAWEKVDIAGAGGIREAIRKIQEIPVLAVSNCVAALPARSFSFRNVKLPFKDRKKIAQTLPFELEAQIPYPPDSAVIDHLVLAQAEGSELLVVAIPKAEVQDRLALLSEYGFAPAALEMDAVPIASRLMAAGEADALNLLLDVGTSETTAILFKGGRILQIRSIPFGGEHITAALAKALGIGFDEAEALKRRGDTERAADEISESCQKLLSALKNTLNALRSSGVLDTDLGKVYLTGGGSLYRKLADDLARVMLAPVERVNVTATAGIRPVGGADSGWDSMIMNGALALALRPLAKGPGFDFRQGEGRPQVKRLSFDLGIKIKWAAAVAGLIVALAGADLYLGYHADKERLDRLKGETEALFKQHFPDVTRIVDPAQQFRSKVAEAKRLAAASRGSRSGVSALDVLKDLSERAPETSGLEVTSLVYDGDKVDIRGEAAGFEAAEAVKKELEKTGHFDEISVSSSSLKSTNRVAFEMKTSLARK